jgi:hypothetical protein
MIGHQTVGVAEPTVAADDLGKRGKKMLAVSIGEKHPLTGVTTGSQMIDGAAKLQAKGTSHGALLSSHLLDCKT